MYKIYLGSVLLPIAPEKITLKIKNENKTLKLINEGEVNFLKDAGLTDIELDVLIPAVQYPFAEYDSGFKSPSFFTNHFEKLKVDKKPFRFIVVRNMPNGRVLFDTNMSVSIESYTIKEQAKDGFDLTVSIKLKQYRYFGTKTLKVTEVSSPATNTQKTNSSSQSTTTQKAASEAVVITQREAANAPLPTKPETHVVKEGETLWSIAKAMYGDGTLYTAIYEANKDDLPNPNLIPAYQVKTLVIPSEQEARTIAKTAKGNSGGRTKDTTVVNM